MDPNLALQLSKDSIFVLLKISAPLMLIALVVGLSISLFQALTQIQEQTLSFVPKIIAMLFGLVLILPFIGAELAELSEGLAAKIIDIGKNER